MLYSLQASRALATFLVVLQHTSLGIFALPKYFDCKPFGDFFHFGNVAVDFFFVMSGFIIAYVHREDVGHPERVHTYLWKRFARVYPVYWVALLAIIPVYFLAPHFGKGYERDPLVILSSFLLLPSEGNQLVLGVAWTMTYEVFFYALFAVAIASRRWGGLVFAAWAVLITAGLLSQFPTSFPWDFLASVLHVRFLAGVLLALVIQRYRIPCPRLVALLGLGLMLTTGWFDVNFQLSLEQRALGDTPGSFLLLAGLIEAERSGLLRAPKLLVFFGDASYSIYLVHFPALSLLAKAAKVLHVDAWVPMTVLFFLLAAGSVLAGCLFHVAVEKPLLRWLRRFSTRPAVAAESPRRLAA